MKYEMSNIALMTDVYKTTHWKFLPKGMTYQTAYLESRGVSDKGVTPETLFVGLQPYIRFLAETRITMADIDEAEIVVNAILGQPAFNREGWEHIVNNLEGKIPAEIYAVEEGHVIPSHNVLLTINSTDKKTPWITNHIESSLLRVWYPITVATTAFSIRRLINKYAKLSGGALNNPFALNDFGARGASSAQSAAIGGCAKLAVGPGTDNIEGIIFARDEYNYEIPISSVPATEHSATIVHGGPENEKEAYEFFMDAYKEGPLSIVIDSFDPYKAIDQILGVELREKIMLRNGWIIARPDSGHPPQQALITLKLLEKRFGGEPNDEGYTVLNPKVRMIYGDFIKYGMIDDILETITNAGYCTDNIVFGMGGALLQQVHRDTYKFAIKTSMAVVNGEIINTSKKPMTDTGKSSKEGELMLVKRNGAFRTIKYDNIFASENLLKLVYRNGEQFGITDMATIKANVDTYLEAT